jgi:broad specificity phosphatase PhoE
MRLILARHGETDLNKAGRVQGDDDTPLNPTGRRQARAIAEALARDMPFSLYASPVPRAMDTARTVSELLEVPFEPLDGLREIKSGALYGLTHKELRRLHPKYMEDWAADPATARSPGGESVLEVQDRAWPAVMELLRRYEQDTVVAISHNFTILAIVCKAVGAPVRNLERFRHDVAAITRLDISNSRSSVVSLNETWHLRDVTPHMDADSNGQG